MSEDEQGSEPEAPQTFPKFVPKIERGNSVLENVESEASPCPIPAEHIRLFEECCTKFEKGEMTDLEVMDHVIKTLTKLKK